MRHAAMPPAAIFIAVLIPLALSQTTKATTKTFDTRACQPPFDTLPYCNASLPTVERVADLISRIWASPEAVKAIPYLLTARNNMSSAIPSLGLPEYDWGMNAGHGVQSSCVDDGSGTVRCPTSFPLPVNFGASWNASLVAAMGSVIGVETRALWLAGAVEQAPRVHVGLNCWSPSINLLRDPRWGRAPEVASEDPFLSGEYGTHYAIGMQGASNGGLLTAVTTIKHWAAYSLENSDGMSRHTFNANITPYSLASSYFPAFYRALTVGKARGVMCSYNAVDGVPSCASPLLTRVLRDAWRFDGYVTSDSGALEDIYQRHHYTSTAQQTVAVALRDGQTDVCSGSVYSGALMPAYNAGVVSREDIDAALTRTFRLRFELGLFDPPSSTPLWSVPLTAVDTAAARATNALAAASSMVLLKAVAGALPLARGRRVAVIGPHGNATAALVNDFLGQLCPSNTFDCVQSPAAAIAAANTGGTVVYEQGTGVSNNSTAGFAAAIAAAAAADVVVMGLGIDDTVEAEETHDRVSIDLPGAQHALTAAIAALGKPTVAFVLSGGPLDLSREQANPNISAIMYAGYPGRNGAAAIAATLFGDNDHCCGRLASTWYAADYVNEIKMSEMELDVGPGRGYRYFNGTPVFPFGYGLSLTNFALSLVAGPVDGASFVTEPAPTSAVTWVVQATNAGTTTGDTVVQAYFLPKTTPFQPKSRLLRQLFAYTRLHLAPGESGNVTITATSATFRMADKETGATVSTPGEFSLLFQDGSGGELRVPATISGAEIVVEQFPGGSSTENVASAPAPF